MVQRLPDIMELESEKNLIVSMINSEEDDEGYMKESGKMGFKKIWFRRIRRIMLSAGIKRYIIPHRRSVNSRSESSPFVNSRSDSSFVPGVNAYEELMSKHYRIAQSASRTEQMNSVENWKTTSMLDLVAENKYAYVSAYDDVIYGSDVPIKLHKHFTEDERMLFCKNRHKRRHTVHVYDNEKLNILLSDYLVIKCVMTMGIVV